MRALSHLGWSTPRRIPEPALDNAAPRGPHCRGQGFRQERCTRGDRDAGGFRARRQGDRRAADLALRGLRLVRAARARRVRGPAADSPGRVPRARVRRRRVHHARDALLAKRLARGGAMAVVGFATLFAGVINGYVAAAATGALLTFVLPVTLPAPNSAIPERLEGWGLAAGAGISALMLLWPPRQRADLQREAAGALRAVADLPRRRPARAGPNVHASRARPSKLWGGVSSAPSTARPARPARWPPSPRFPTSSTGSSPSSRHLREPGLELPAQRTRKRWRRPRPFSVRAPSDSRAATDAPISSGSKRRAMPSLAHSCGDCRSCRPIPRRARCRGRSTLRSGFAR